MPMDRSRYPANWNDIALSVKQAANWTCQGCGRPCRKPDENLFDFVKRIQGCNYAELDWVNQTAIATIGAHPQRYTLTTAHLDQDPGNNAPDNLKALCSVCHLRHDRPFQEANRLAKRERFGQLTVFHLAPPSPAGHGKNPKRVQLPIKQEVVE